MAINENYLKIINNAIKAVHERTFYAQYPEHPKAYGEGASDTGKEAFDASLNKQFNELKQKDSDAFIGEESSPYWQKSLGISYPSFSVEKLVEHSKNALKEWRKVSVDDRADVLVDALERISKRFFEIAYATQHTTGQSFMMSFQASGPHSNDRALEALAMGYEELTKFPSKLLWEKPMGKFSVKLDKKFNPIPKGVALVIGCSTFPIWNSVPGIFASLITGNPVIVKPHPKSVLPIAIVIAEIQNALENKGYSADVCQLAVDGSEKLITKELASHSDVKVIDYTGGTQFGNYVESLTDKTVFTEKAGVNSVILDSVADLKPVVQNIAFAVSLYSGQMCTAPQNIFIPEGGVKVGDDTLSYDEVVGALSKGIYGLTHHPKMGAGTLGAIQSETTLARAQGVASIGAKVTLEPDTIVNEEFADARVCTPALLEVNSSEVETFAKELFGPIVIVIKTKNTDESIQLAKDMAEKHGAITCAAYSTNESICLKIEEEMESVFVPVSFNFTGMIWVNQHSAFSDFHVTGGNPAGNASFTNPEYINKRFVWVGHRSVSAE